MFTEPGRGGVLAGRDFTVVTIDVLDAEMRVRNRAHHNLCQRTISRAAAMHEFVGDDDAEAAADAEGEAHSQDLQGGHLAGGHEPNAPGNQTDVYGRPGTNQEVVTGIREPLFLFLVGQIAGVHADDLIGQRQHTEDEGQGDEGPATTEIGAAKDRHGYDKDQAIAPQHSGNPQVRLRNQLNLLTSSCQPPSPRLTGHRSVSCPLYMGSKPCRASFTPTLVEPPVNRAFDPPGDRPQNRSTAGSQDVQSPAVTHRKQVDGRSHPSLSRPAKSADEPARRTWYAAC